MNRLLGRHGGTLDNLTVGKMYVIDDEGEFYDDAGDLRGADYFNWGPEGEVFCIPITKEQVGFDQEGTPRMVDALVGKVNGEDVVSDGKADVGKIRMGLLYVQFGNCLSSVAQVLTFGAQKYPKPPLDDSWRDVPNGRERYVDAALRHFNAYFVKGEKLDPESGENHLAHLMCCLLFIWRLDDGKE